jgi:hypothetical protein
MPFREIIVIYSDNHMKRTNSPCDRKTSQHAVHIISTGLYGVKRRMRVCRWMPGMEGKKEQRLCIIFLLSLVGWDLRHQVLRPLLAYFTAPDDSDGDCGAIGGMKIGRGNRSTRRKPAPAPLCPPQNPHDQTRARTRAAAEGSQRLTLELWRGQQRLCNLSS